MLLKVSIKQQAPSLFGYITQCTPTAVSNQVATHNNIYAKSKCWKINPFWCSHCCTAELSVACIWMEKKKGLKAGGKPNRKYGICLRKANNKGKKKHPDLIDLSNTLLLYLCVAQPPGKGAQKSSGSQSKTRPFLHPLATFRARSHSPFLARRLYTRQ